MNKIPILYLIFNREDSVRESFLSIKKYRPTKLYIGADGPRPDKVGEDLKCESARQTVLDMIDWNCEVQTLFRKSNLGCANAVNDAVSWFFANEEYGIIIEDDCIIHEDFYTLCEEFLPLYKEESKVMVITAQNNTPNLNKADEIVFTNNTFIWGWASWRRAWEHMDMTMAKWPTYNYMDLVKNYGFFYGSFMWYYWTKAYKNIQTLSSWATRWKFAVLVNNGLCLSSNVNLSKNVGIGIENSTHYSIQDKDPYAHVPFGKVKWPLKLPNDIKVSREKLYAERKEFFRMRKVGVRKKIKFKS